LSQLFSQLLSNIELQIKQGNLNAALASYAQLKSIAPEKPDVLFVAAKLAMMQGQFHQAYMSLLSITVDDSSPAKILEKTLKFAVQLELHFVVLKLLERLTDLFPDHIQWLYHKGLANAQCGHIEQAITLFKKCIKLQPENPYILLNLGHMYKALANTPSAVQNYQAFIQKSPQQQGMGYWSLADLKNFEFDHTTLESLSSYTLASNTPENLKNVGLVQFALARALEQKKDYASAMIALHAANKNTSYSRTFRKQAYINLITDLCNYVPNEQCKQKTPDCRPIFIVGMPRSGTTLTEQILASHSEIHTTDELPFMERAAMQMTSPKGYTAGLLNINKQKSSELRTYYLAQARQYFVSVEEAPCFIDKNPNNFLHVGLILKLFPNAKIICQLRDPIDNILSVYKQHFSKGYDFAYNIEDIICYLNGYYHLLKRYQQLYPGSILLFNYGNLVEAPEKNIRQLLNFCELEFESDCLNFHRSTRSVLTPSSSQVRQPINKKSINSSEQYKPFLAEYQDEFEQLENEIKQLINHD
jgi:tetratricopeptide (TPR) repeat protein